MHPVNLTHLQSMKQKGEKIACLTCYDASFAHLLSEAGTDVFLIGDTLGMVVGGHKTTLPVTLSNIIYHTQSVCRADPKSLIIADMPFLSYSDPKIAIKNAGKLMQAGAQMVKLEGGLWLRETVEKLSEQGIPTCLHLGLTPQSVHNLGGYRVQGRDTKQAQVILESAIQHESSGAKMIVLECVPSDLAREITKALTIPVIGIGAGAHCDGQILVLYDMLGITPGKPLKFVKNFLEEKNSDRNMSIKDAIKEYVRQVKSGEFPTQEHSFV